MVHTARAVSHQSEISRGSGEAPDWIVLCGEQTHLLRGRRKRGRKGENDGGWKDQGEKIGSKAEKHRGREEEEDKLISFCIYEINVCPKRCILQPPKAADKSI